VLSVTLFAATLACLVVPPLNVWAGPLLVVLFITNPPVVWSALGLTGLGGLAYLLRRNRP
jgi:hypothetical protein